jgi:hypothetical protein
MTEVNYTDENAPGNDFANLLKAEVRPIEDHDWPIKMGDSFEIIFLFRYKQPEIINIDVTFHLTDEMSNIVFVSSTGSSQNKKFGPGLISATCRIPVDIMHEGSYCISRLLLVINRGTVALNLPDVLFFDIVNPGSDDLGRMEQKEGIVKPNLHWKFNNI